MFYRYSVDEILNLVEADNSVISANIYLAPPTNCFNSDEDSGDEDEADINRLTKNQLLSNAEASITYIQDNEVISQHITSETPFETTSDSDDTTQTDIPSMPAKSKTDNIYSSLPSTSSLSNTFDFEDDLPSTSKKAKVICNKPIQTNTKKFKKFDGSKTKTQKSYEKTYKWVKKDLSNLPHKEWQMPEWLTSIDRSPVEMFELFYDEEVVSLIRDMTNKYASEKGDPAGYTLEDIKCFLAILLVSGYNQVPRVKMYWETKDDVMNQAISQAMPRNKFLNIMRCLHVCDNADLDKNTKFAKVVPLWNMMNKRFLKYFVGDANLCIDESMIPYYGRHSAKQHIHGKPIRFGYKAWCLCTRLGYLIQAIPYEGASTTNKYPDIGVGGSVVIELAEKLPARTDGYNFFFDNFFTSVTLLQVLKQMGSTGTGTVRANRVCKAPLTDVKAMKKKPRGSYEQLTEAKTNVTLVRYNDNSVCTVASTFSGVEPIGKVRRYSAAEKKHITVPQPSCVVMYNQYMGGVDRLDENISKLRVGIRGKKWYWQLLAFPLNVSVNNAWLLYRMTTFGKEKPLDHLAFTREITLSYLKKYSCRVNPGRPLHNKVGAVDKRVTADVRFDNIGHMIDSSEKQTRCGHCKKNTTKKCVKCGIAMHSKCFILFHTK